MLITPTISATISAVSTGEPARRRNSLLRGCRGWEEKVESSPKDKGAPEILEAGRMIWHSIPTATGCLAWAEAPSDSIPALTISHRGLPGATCLEWVRTATSGVSTKDYSSWI